MFGNSPAYLQELKPSTNADRHNRNLRFNNNLNLPNFRINRYKHSLIPKAITFGNELPEEVRSIENYTEFKTYLEKNVPQPNPLFNLGNRDLNIIASRIRMKSSNLNGHLFQLGLTDDPSCKCGYFFEDTVHFLLVCPIYLTQRTLLHNAVGPLAPFNVRTLLYGCPDLNCNQNDIIYFETLNFINSSCRFK